MVPFGMLLCSDCMVPSGILLFGMPIDNNNFAGQLEVFAVKCLLWVAQMSDKSRDTQIMWVPHVTPIDTNGSNIQVMQDRGLYNPSDRGYYVMQ